MKGNINMKTGIMAPFHYNSRFGKDQYKKLKSFGFDCTDLGLANTETQLYTLPENEAIKIMQEEKKLADEAGVEIHQIHGPWRWPPNESTPEGLAERMDKMKKSIRLASSIGCKNWIIHPVMPFGIHEIDTPDAPTTYSINIEFMGELVKTAREYDVIICYENMPMTKFSIATPAQLMKVINEINDDHFCACLDTGHVMVFEGHSIGDAVRTFGKKLRTMHVHDNNGVSDLHYLPVFGGRIDWKEYADALREIGFDGTFSLECSPNGKLPDKIYEDMFRICADHIREILK